MHIHGARLCSAVVTPDVVHELLTGEDLPGGGDQLVQQLELLLRQENLLAPPLHAEGVIDQGTAADLQLPLRHQLRPSQQVVWVWMRNVLSIHF